ncbi:innexin unc-9-like [Liolophura sinensis]|uniref:innexin unc-9-like n=1 Tax=Liolophura sinensis TaxID=3198878 RepID=UPI0031580D1C
MIGVFGSLASYNKLKGSNDDDWVDRLNHIYTVVLLAIFAVFVSTGTYVGDPIQCWCPAQFTGSYVAYTKWICWVSNTYYLPMEKPIPVEIPTREDRELTYYQWVPVILLFMALLFKMPCVFWRIFSSGSGVNLEKVVDLTVASQLGSPEKREETIRHIAIYLDRWLETHREYRYNMYVRMRQRLSRVCCFFCGKREGTYLTGFYLVIKALFVANVISQFFLLNGFMGGFYSVYGFEVIHGLMNNYNWKESYRFPRVTLCDFEIRQLQNIQRYTVQCVLPINLFNEKIFIFIWFWFAFVAAITTGNFLFWLWRVLFKRNRNQYVKKYLKVMDQIHTTEDKKICQKFADQYLRDDGLFVLRLVRKNSNEMLLGDLIRELWKIFCAKPLVRKNSEDYDESQA